MSSQSGLSIRTVHRLSRVKTEGGGQLVNQKLLNAHILPVVFLSDTYQMVLIWRKSYSYSCLEYFETEKQI